MKEQTTGVLAPVISLLQQRESSERGSLTLREVRPSTGSNAPQTPTLDPALQFEQAARQRVLHAPYIPSLGARDVPPIYAVIKLGLTNESS